MSGSAPVIFQAGVQAGGTLLQNHPDRVRAIKRENQVQVRFSKTESLIDTLEGPVHAAAGDAIITGAQGEQWPVSAQRFAEKYQAADPLQQGADGTYTTVPIDVFALSMETEFVVVLNDGHSRIYGTAGDWLVDYRDGTLGIVAPAIFGATYEVKRK